ncbi:MAG: histidine phosphatase family protein [Polyangiaceae bacterium]
MPTKMLFLRHGETLHNRNRIFQGQSGDGLSDLGREQARLAATRLAGLGVRFDALYTSDLERARETAAAVSEALGLTAIAHAGLREVALGAWEGLRDFEVEAKLPEEWAAWRRGEDVRRGGGETLAEVTARMVAAMHEIHERHRGERVVAVSHGAAIKCLVASVLGTTALRLRALQPIANTGATLVAIDDAGAASVRIYNDAAHLGDAVAAAIGS